MRLLEGRQARADNFDLNGGQSRGPTHVVRAARDAIKFPDDPTVVKMVEDAMCFGSLGENCYILKNVYGDERAVAYDATLVKWRGVLKELVDLALQKALNP